MYLDEKFLNSCKLLIPSEILYNLEVKQLLPVYFTLCVVCDMSYGDVTQREVTIRQLCKSTCTMNVINLRRGQYTTLKNAMLWLQEHGYADYEGIDWEDTGHSFKIRMNKDIYALVSTREDKRDRGYTKVSYGEVLMIRTALFYLDKTENTSEKIMSTYFYMRSRCLLWQKELGTSLPVWCGNFSQICATFNIPARSFTRIIKTMKELELISVTRLNYNYGKTSKMPTEIVAFNFLCENEDAYTVVKHAQEQLCKLYGEHARWYLTGETAAKKKDGNKEPAERQNIGEDGLPPCVAVQETADSGKEPVELTGVDLKDIIPEEAMKEEDTQLTDNDELFEKYMDALDAF